MALGVKAPAKRLAISHGFASLLIRQPLGVVGSIAPWNFPLIMALWHIGPAPATSNAAVLKPAPTRREPQLPRAVNHSTDPAPTTPSR